MVSQTRSGRQTVPSTLAPRGSDTTRNPRIDTPFSRKKSKDAPIRRSERVEKVTGSSSLPSKEYKSSPLGKMKKVDEKKERKTSAAGTRDESNARKHCFSDSGSSKKRKWIDSISYRKLLKPRPTVGQTPDVSARARDDNASVVNMVKSTVGDSAEGLVSGDECPLFKGEEPHAKHCYQEANEVEGHSNSVSREPEVRETGSSDSLNQKEGLHECIKTDASGAEREEFEESPSQELALGHGLSATEISLKNKALSISSESAHRTTAFGSITSELISETGSTLLAGTDRCQRKADNLNELAKLSDIDSVEVKNKRKATELKNTDINSLVSWLQFRTNKGAVQENALGGIHSLSETVTTSAKNGTSLPISNLSESDVPIDQELVITQSGTNSDNGVNHAIHSEHASPISSRVNKAYTLDSGGRGTLHDAQRSLHLLLKPELLKLCEVLDLPDNVKDLALMLLEYIMTNHQVDQQPETTTQALKISLCLRASSLLKHKITRQESLSLAKKNLGFICYEDEVNMVYSKLRILKRKFHAEKATLKTADVSNDLECHSIDIEKYGRRPVGKTSSNSELYKCHESDQSKHVVDVGDLISKQKMAEKELAALKNNPFESNIKLIDKICAQRAKKIHLKQQQELSELEIYEMKEELNIKKVYDKELMLFHGIVVDSALRSEKIRLLNEELSEKMSRFKVHMNRQLDKLKGMQLISWNTEHQIKDRWIQKAKVGQLEDSFHSIPLSDSGFRLHEFAELKEANIQDDLKSTKHSSIISWPSPDEQNVDLIIIDSPLPRGSTGDNSDFSLFASSEGVGSTPIYIQTSASRSGSADEAEPIRPKDTILEVTPIVSLQEEADLLRKTDNMVSLSCAMNTEGTETNSTLMADVAQELQGGAGLSDVSLEKAGVPMITDKMVSQPCAMTTEAIETNRTHVADVANEQHDGAGCTDVSCLRLSPLLMDVQERNAGNDGFGHLTSSPRDGAEFLQVYVTAAGYVTGASLNQEADRVLQERPQESISLEEQDCRSAEDIQPSRSTDVDSFELELVNNGMTASDPIQPVLSASRNLSSLGQREQSSVSASIENHEEPLKVMQCSAEPNDSPLQVPAGWSSHLELSAGNELVIHGPQASAFLSTQNQEGTLNLMPCSAEDIQPSRSTGIGSLPLELINNDMTAYDPIQPVLQASSNIPSLGQREQSSTPASVENHEEPLNVMQCSDEPNDSSLQVPSESSSNLELSPANELVVNGPRQESAFLSIQNQEGTLNLMTCSAEDIQPSRSTDVGSLQLELINNDMNASDPIQPVLSASSNFPSFGQREQSNAPASIENNEEPLNGMQCSAEPNDSSLQVPAGSSSHLELSAGNELVILGPRQESAFPSTPNQEETLNLMPCSAQQIDIALPVSVGSTSLLVEQFLPVEQFSQLVSHPDVNPLLANLDVSLRATSEEPATGIHLEPVHHFQLFPFVPLPYQNLHAEPLKNELTRIRIQQEKVSKMHDDRKLGIKREFEEEMEKLRTKYDRLNQDADSEFLENTTTLKTIYNKVLMNHILAEQFKAQFIEVKGPISRSFQGQNTLQGSQTHLDQRPVLTSCMPTTVWQPQLSQRSVLTSSMPNSVGSALPTVVAPVQVASVRLRGPASVVAPMLSGQTPRNTALNFQRNAVGPYFNSAVATSANISAGNEIRAPAPHLHRFRSAPSLPSHNISIPTSVTASQQHVLTNIAYTTKGEASLPANAHQTPPVPRDACSSPTASPFAIPRWKPI